METSNKNILWLASWYPNPADPFDGDFVQRHAKAVSLHHPLTVFYVAQLGENADAANTGKIISQASGQLTEHIIFFNYKKTGVKPADKVLYNRAYIRTYKKAIREYINANGLPAVVHVHVPMKAGLLAVWLKRKYNIPFVTTEHAAIYDEVVPDNFWKRNAWFRSMVSLIFKKSSAVTAVSAALAKQLKEQFTLASVSVVCNVADTGLFFLPEKKPDQFRFIHVSTMTYQKNVEGLLKVLGRLRAVRDDWSVTMLGNDKQALKDLAFAQGLDDCIEWKGIVPYHEVAGQMQCSSSLVLFSRYENFPCVIVEALCCGLPVISASVGGIAEAIDETNGLLVEPENEDQLLEAMVKMIEEYDRYNRDEIAAAAAAKFNYETVGKQFMTLYQQL